MKKILNIFAGISLMTAGSSNVVACGGSTNNDQQIVNDITSHLKNKTFGVDENINGYQNFTYYRSIVLADIQSKLTNQEKDLVSLPPSDNTKTLNVEEPTAIHVGIQSHNVSGHVDVSVKLNNDAQSIADKINAQKTITVYKPLHGPPDKKYHSFTLAPINEYQSQIETQIHQLLSSKGIKSNYQLTFNNWPINPKTHKIVNLDWINNVNVNLKVNIGKNVSKIVHIQVKLNFDSKYNRQKEEIDNPAEGSKFDPEPVDTGGATVTTDEWNDYGVYDALDTDWAFGGFSQYITFVPINTLIPNTPVKEELYCPLMGYTKNNPRIFYVEAH